MESLISSISGCTCFQRFVKVLTFKIINSSTPLQSEQMLVMLRTAVKSAGEGGGVEQVAELWQDHFKLS